jgi:hypothetical protein
LNFVQVGPGELIEPRDAEQAHGGDDLAFEYFENPHQAGLTGGGESPALRRADGNVACRQDAISRIRSFSFSSPSTCNRNLLIRFARFVRCDPNGNFAIQPLEKFKQFVSSEAAVMAIHQMRHV